MKTYNPKVTNVGKNNYNKMNGSIAYTSITGPLPGFVALPLPPPEPP